MTTFPGNAQSNDVGPRRTRNWTRGEAFHDLQNAPGTLATEDEGYAQYHAKRLADSMFEVVTATLLLEGAQRQLENEDDGGRSSNCEVRHYSLQTDVEHHGTLSRVDFAEIVSLRRASLQLLSLRGTR